MTLIRKSEENERAARFAAKKGCYNVAVSRYYYSMLQKMLYYLKMKNKDLKVYEGKESHKKIKEDFMETFDKEYSGNNKNILRISFNHFGMIKKFRVRADYHDSNINHEEYNTRIKTDLLKLLNSLKQIEK